MRKIFVILIVLSLFTGSLMLLQHQKKELVFESAERTQPVRHLVIHSFVSTPQEMSQILHEEGLSTHYMIGADGTIYPLVPESRVAWHAGPSFWAGQSGLNATSVGIELEHSDYGQTPYPEKQIKALIRLAKKIIKRHDIPPENIVAHSDIAPEAKMDPGRGFPWQKMAEAGVGLWYDLKDDDTLPNLTTAQALSVIGYPVQGRQLQASCWAFRQRFMPQTVAYDSGIAERGNAMYLARQKTAKLPPKEREEILKNAPAIFPTDEQACPETPEFLKTLHAVASIYQQARKTPPL